MPSLSITPTRWFRPGSCDDRGDGVPRALVLALSTLLVVLGAAPAVGSVGADPVGEWPLQPVPEVSAGFDPPTDPWGAGHRGVDLLGSAGQPVRAALRGRISYAGRLAGRGVVVVDHGPTRTTYEPVTATLAVGEQVRAGETIGRLELVGSHCFPRACLHWGWIRGETYLDPLDLVGAGPVRLLPLWRTEPVPAGRPAAVLPYSGRRTAIALPTSLPVYLPAPVLTPADAPAGRPGGAGRW